LLAIVPRPRGGDWLDDEVRAIRAEGYDVLVSLLTEAEMQELGLTEEADLARGQGLEFCNYPIPDLGVPGSREAARQLVDKLYGNLMAGKKIAIHCRGSIGRSGLLASSILVMSGLAPQTAFRQVSAARGFYSPETPEQRDWVVAFSLEFAESAA